MHTNKTFMYQQGQVALIVVLTSIVIFTIGVSSAARITSDIKIASRTEEAEQAIAAAEAGLERALLAIKNSPMSPSFETGPRLVGTSATYTVNASVIPGNIAGYSLGSVQKGTTKTVWLNDYPTDPFNSAATSYAGDITIDWDIAAPGQVGLEFNIYYIVGTTIGVKRDFVVTGGNPRTYNLAAGAGLPLSSRAILMRIHPSLQDLTELRIFGFDTATFPIQGYDLEISAKTVQNEISRKIIAQKFFEDYPSYFDFVLYSDGNITKFQN